MTLRALLRRDSAGDRSGEERLARCLACDVDLAGSRSYDRHRVCHACGHHYYLNARERVESILDPASFRETDRSVTALDPIQFRERQSYRHRVLEAQRRTGLAEAALTGTGTLYGREVVIAALDFSFLGGSIGVASGERLARAFERAANRGLAVVTVLSTSGVRMREGLFALMQLPRLATAHQKLAEKGLPHITLLSDPSTGSAFAGLANLADFIIAEPDALVGYSALREMRERAGEELPEDAHTSESHLRRGLIDAVVKREDLRPSLGLLTDLLMSNYELRPVGRPDREPREYSRLEAWRQVQLSRHENRPTTADLVRRMTTTFVEIHGDRSGEDDPAISAGLGLLAGEAVVLIGQNRLQGLASPGTIGPSGFHKARRAMRLARKFRLPLITLIDSAGARPDLAAEEAGLGDAIARCMREMLRVPSPSLAIITGEGASEAAVAMGVADRVLMLENAVYEVVSPEDAARRLYGDASHVDEVAERLRLTSHDCVRLGIVDTVVPEPGEGAHTNHDEAALLLRRFVVRSLTASQRERPRRRLNRRGDRYRNTGETHAWVRGRVERRLADLTDRFTHWRRRMGRQPRRAPRLAETPADPEIMR